MSDTWTIYTDGGSRGNPGPAAYAYVIKRPGVADIEEKVYFGQTTNNIAEYTGLVKALEHAKELGGRKLVVNSDSELMVKQMNGQYRVKNAGLLPLYQQAVALRKQFDSVAIKHVYREQNARADRLCNEALDNPRHAKPRSFVGQDANPVESESVAGVGTPTPGSDYRPRPRTTETRSESRPTKKGKLAPTPLMQALEIMRQSAALWAENGDPTTPAPAEVLNRICEIVRHAEPEA
jgi:ribonuclease HI